MRTTWKQKLLRKVPEISDDWLVPGIILLACLGIGASFGARAVTALRQNGTLDTVVVWFGRGSGNMTAHTVRELFVLCAFWCLGAITVFFWGRARTHRPPGR